MLFLGGGGGGREKLISKNRGERNPKQKHTLIQRERHVPKFEKIPKEEYDQNGSIVVPPFSGPVVAPPVGELVAGKGREEGPQVEDTTEPSVDPLGLVLYREVR